IQYVERALEDTSTPLIRTAAPHR
ncbi:MAG: hypothetical protein QOH74_1355, partial [Gaiellales bacterium]|nr:hypothetical protein [Gaiellales bacterium]